MDGWVGGKAVLRIAYSNQRWGKKHVPGWMGGCKDICKSCLKDCLQQ